MEQYHKIHSIFKRNMAGDKKLIIGDWADPTFEFLASCEWTFTEKVDGTNIRVIVPPSTTAGEPAIVQFKGKTDAAVLPGPLREWLLKTFDEPLCRKLYEQFPFGACLYGEGYGGKIQNMSKVYGPDQRFILFDVLIGNYYWIERTDLEGMAAGWGLEVVPVIGTGTLMAAVAWAQRGIVTRWPNGGLAEGIVARPKTELKDRRGNRIIAKIKCKDFDAPAV